MLGVSKGVLNIDTSNVMVQHLAYGGVNSWWCPSNKFKLLIVARILHLAVTKGGLYRRNFDDREEIHSLAADCSKGVQISIDGVLAKILIKVVKIQNPYLIYSSS